PDDFVRIEIAWALTRRKRLIPLLVNGARMPDAERLPDDLKPLAHRNAWALAPHDRFARDCEGLIKVLKEALQEADTVRRAAAAEGLVKEFDDILKMEASRRLDLLAKPSPSPSANYSNPSAPAGSAPSGRGFDAKPTREDPSAQEVKHES